jgi:uncharacterized membrane protein
MNRQEKWAWIRSAFTASALVFLCWNLFFLDAPDSVNDWKMVEETISTLFFAMLLAFGLLIRPGQGVIEDERDRAISAMAGRAALVALSLIVLVSATIIGSKSHTGLLATLSGAWVEQYLIACLALAWWIEASVCAFHHWRDRR